LASERVGRRLTAILAADVAGYSSLMGADEEGTLAQLKAHRQALVDPKIAEHHGRIVKTTGDGMLVEFASVVDAVRCAVEVQSEMVARNSEVADGKRIEFRMGINVGDIIIDGGDIFGDGVNVAARLEGLAAPGGICVSGRVVEDVRGKLAIDFEDAGEQQLKNIARLVRVYRVRPSMTSQKSASLLPDKPSIAVLPFQNMSSDAEQEYFADGMVEDIITALSRTRWLFVIARNSSFTFKGRAVDVRQVGRELGVRYVLEGSVRKAANRVRITGQLIDASNGAHLWADRFDGALEDIFDLQDQVTASVVSAIAPKLEQAEIDRAKRKPTANLDAYDYFLRAMASFHTATAEGLSEALRLCYRAIELDPDFASPYAMAARCIGWRKSWGLLPTAEDITEVARLVRQAAQLGAYDAFALSSGGYAISYVVGDLDGGAELIDRALALNPNLADAWRLSGWVNVWRGAPDMAIKHFMQAMRMNPIGLLIGITSGIAFAHFFAARFDEASSWAERGLREQPDSHQSLRIAAASHALAGRIEAAQKAMARLRQIDPVLRVSNLKELTPLRRPEDIARYKDGLRKAGLPE
jgi:adenylate cyclase